MFLQVSALEITARSRLSVTVHISCESFSHNWTPSTYHILMHIRLALLRGGTPSGGGTSGGPSRSRLRSRSRSRSSSGPTLAGVPELPEGAASASTSDGFECIASRRLVKCTFGTRAGGGAPYATVAAALSGWTSVLMSR